MPVSCQRCGSNSYYLVKSVATCRGCWREFDYTGPARPEPNPIPPIPVTMFWIVVEMTKRIAKKVLSGVAICLIPFVYLLAAIGMALTLVFSSEARAKFFSKDRHRAS